jgi:hypothetical protein
MGRILKVLGVAFLLLVLAVAGMLVWAHASGAAIQKEFFDAVATGDAARVRALMHEEFKKDVDEPILAAFLDAFNDKHGAFQGLSWTKFGTSSRKVEGKTETTSAGTVNFEKGPAKCKLITCDGLFRDFKVKSNLLGDDWLPPELDTTLYRRRGKELLEAILTGRVADAHAMTCEKFQDEHPLEEFAEQINADLADVGKLKSLEHDREELTLGTSPKLKVRYRMTTTRGQATPVVVFLFAGFKGHLVQFSLNAAE